MARPPAPPARHLQAVRGTFGKWRKTLSTIGHELGRARRDGVAVLLLPLLAWGLAGHFELSERLAAWFSGLEPWQADELPFTLLVLAAALAWYAFRRRTEAAA